LQFRKAEGFADWPRSPPNHNSTVPPYSPRHSSHEHIATQQENRNKKNTFLSVENCTTTAEPQNIPFRRTSLSRESCAWQATDDSLKAALESWRHCPCTPSHLAPIAAASRTAGLNTIGKLGAISIAYPKGFFSTFSASHLSPFTLLRNNSSLKKRASRSTLSPKSCMPGISVLGYRSHEAIYSQQSGFHLPAPKTA
jgi:hypothetical protein